ncbi:uncharacterized protein LOC130303153 [Hyla sarda]|uniref:uncharacterized protein LOC130303153 n=1 Tax=Hyla sarda TaxID=327740 RepID=UPI0024C20CDD|nr:uncharacterized protein LOC130303153 [Hyla sarda]
MHYCGVLHHLYFSGLRNQWTQVLGMRAPHLLFHFLLLLWTTEVLPLSFCCLKVDRRAPRYIMDTQMDTNIETISTPHSTDVFSYSKVDADRILGSLTINTSFLHNPSKIDLKRSYESETKKLLTVQLHLSTLSEYYRTRRIPRGMRAQPRTNAFTNDTDFRTCYEAISNKYSLDLILLNIEFLQRDMATLKTKVTEVEIALKASLTEEEWRDLSDKQQAYLEKQRVQIEETKRHKWFRDCQDYTNGHVYTWENTVSTYKRFQKRNETDIEDGTVRQEQQGHNRQNKQNPFLVHMPPVGGGQEEEGANTNEVAKTRAQKSGRTQQHKQTQQQRKK